MFESELIPVAGGRFASRLYDQQITFVRDSDGKVTGMPIVWPEDPEPVRAKRVP